MDRNPPRSNATYDPRQWFSISNAYEHNTQSTIQSNNPKPNEGRQHDPRIHRAGRGGGSGGGSGGMMRDEYGAYPSHNNHNNRNKHNNNYSIHNNNYNNHSSNNYNNHSNNYNNLSNNNYLSDQGNGGASNHNVNTDNNTPRTSHQADHNNTPQSNNTTPMFTPAPPTTTSNYNTHDNNNTGKLEHYIQRLQEMVRQIPHKHQKKFPYDVICELAHSFLDGTVFEITLGLSEIQSLTESNLAGRRNKLLEGHRASKKELLRQQKAELAMFERKPQQLKAMLTQHEGALDAFTQQCQKETTNLDQKLVLELDRQVSDQQSTLQRAGLPYFFITNDPEEIKVQMYLLSFITRLSAGWIFLVLIIDFRLKYLKNYLKNNWIASWST